MKNRIRQQLTPQMNLQIALLMLALLFGIGTAQAAVFTVTNTNDSGAGSLRDAINQSNVNGEADTINFDATVFAAHQTIHLNNGFQILADGKLTINGPAAGVTLSLANSNVFPRRVFSLFGAAPNLEISNLTLTGGNTFQGGAIYSEGTVMVNNSIITGNSTTETGGGITNRGGTLTVTNSTVSHNSSPLAGGVFNGNGGITRMINSTVSNNSSNDVGGVYNNNGTMILTKMIVSGNSANSYGGGIYNFQGVLSLNNSTVSGNSAQFGGGGIINYDGTLTLTNSTVSNNSSRFGGGIFNGNNGVMTIIESTVSNNSATRFGGGIYSAPLGSTVTMTNSTVSGNSGQLRGGGIYTFGIFQISNSTVSNNSSLWGGGVHQANGEVRPFSNIFADNTSPNGPDYAGYVFSLGYNLFETPPTTGGNLPTDLVGLDPMLGPLQNNGGPTETHALLAGSPAIDAGNSTLMTDQRGFPRPVDFPIANAPGGNGSDIGAFEAGKEQCKQGGWRILGGGTFRNQGDCVSFVNTGR